MEEKIENEKQVVQNEQIVILDECGDTLWDAVLEQEAIKALFE